MGHWSVHGVFAGSSFCRTPPTMERYGASAAPEILKRPRGLVKIIGLRLDEPEGAHLRHALQAHLTPSLTPPGSPRTVQVVSGRLALPTLALCMGVDTASEQPGFFRALDDNPLLVN